MAKVKAGMCWNCGKYKAEYKDYRQDEQGNVNKELNCRYCNPLNDVWYYRVRAEGINPKTLSERG